MVINFNPTEPRSQLVREIETLASVTAVAGWLCDVQAILLFFKTCALPLEL